MLAFKHYDALERRISNIMKYILECMDKQTDGLRSMIITEYHNPNVAEPLPGEDIDATEDEDPNADEGIPPEVPAPMQPVAPPAKESDARMQQVAPPPQPPLQAQ